MPVHNYIIRIYRHDNKHPERIVGIVEDVENQDKHAFEDFDELQAIICTPKKELTPKRKKTSRQKNTHKE